MSIEVRFSLSKGLKAPITVPKGTLTRIKTHIAETVAAISPCDGGPLWGRLHPQLTDEALCEAARRHNAYIECLWEVFFPDSPYTCITEEITPEDAAGFWFALAPIVVPINRWTREYAVFQLHGFFETLRGRAQHGVHFDAKPLSIEQASAAIYVVKHLFGLDVGDLDPQAPRMWLKGDRKEARLNWVDELRTNPETAETQRYEWCEQCGAVAIDPYVTFNCPRRKCPLKNEEEG